MAFSIKRDDDDGPQVLRLMGDIDLEAADELVRVATAVEGERIVLDVQAVAFIDSSGLDALLRIHRQRVGALVLRNPPPGVSRVLDLAGLRSHFAIEIIN